MLITLLDIIHVFVCLFLMLVVLLQQGKGGGMGAAFGGGATQQVFGGRGAGNILTRATAICAYVIRQGFSHISDDDYARSVIAERFAYAPGLDPSGTSWLPLPFWITGAAMVAAGRSLATARGVALALGAASIAAPYAAMR